MNKSYNDQSWINSKIILNASHIEGHGLFAKDIIKKGELLVVWGGVILTSEEVKSGKALDQTCCQIEEDVYMAEIKTKDISIDDHMNHSCDPNVWMKDEVTLIARRSIHPGEELTADYAMWVTDPKWKLNCNCNTEECRKIITGKDWMLKELQKKYEGCFPPYINRRIRKLSQKHLNNKYLL